MSPSPDAPSRDLFAEPLEGGILIGERDDRVAERDCLGGGTLVVLRHEHALRDSAALERRPRMC